MDKVIEVLKNYGTQKSTYLGILGVLSALGVISFAPEAQAELVNYAVNIATGILGVWSAYNVIKNERKDD